MYKKMSGHTYQICMGAKKSDGNTKKTKHIPTVIAALLILAASIALWYFPKEYAYRLQPPRDQNHNPENGVWDLRGFDLDGQIIFLEGPVEYVAGKLLTPEEFAACEGEALYGVVPANTQVATARLRLLFPEDKIYSLASGSSEYNERIYVNGHWRHDVGAPGLTAEESTPSSNFNQFNVMPENGVVEIIRQSSNFVHKEGGGYTGYYVGSSANIKQMVSVNQNFTAISIGLYLCLFLLHMVLYLVVGGYRPNLWFALLCFMWLLRAGFTGRFVYATMFPDIPWAMVYRLGCASIAFTGILLLLLVRDEFPGVVQKWPMFILCVGQILFLPLYLVADTIFSSRIKVVSEILLCVAVAYLAIRFIIVLPKQARQKKLLPEQIITITGLAVAVFTLLHDMMRYNNWLRGIFYYEIGDVGVMALVLFQMAAMILGTMRQLTEARHNEKIAWQTAEIARKEQKLALLRAESAEQDLELHKRIIADIPRESLVTFGPFTLNTERQQAFIRDEDMLLVPREFALLLHLVRQAGKPISSKELYEAVWRQPYVPTDRSLISIIYRLRKKFTSSGYGVLSARGKGYWLEEE